MAAVSPTSLFTLNAADIELTSSTGNGTNGKAGEAITAGQWIHLDTTTNLIYVADSSHATRHKVTGIAVNSCLASQQCGYVAGGTLTVTTGQTVGDIGVLGAVGEMIGEADLASGDYVVMLAIPTATDAILLGIRNTGIQKP